MTATDAGPEGGSTRLPRLARRLRLARRAAMAALGGACLATLAPGVGHAEPPLPAETMAAAASTNADADIMRRFLDRLMQAESGGRDDARNPRSTAFGPFQFIESTFLEVCRRHFAAETAGLAPAQILALRSDRSFARRAAEAFTRDNAAILAGRGLEPSPQNLRLAFLLGAAAAVRVITGDGAEPVIRTVGAAVVQANPFMAGMSNGDLIAWSGRSIGERATAGPITASPPPATDTSEGAVITAARPRGVTPACNMRLPSCRKWTVLTERRIHRQVALSTARRTRIR